MRILVVLLALSACVATPAQLAAARCDPATDLETCDDAGVRRMACDPKTGQWTPVQECFAPQYCQRSAPNDAGQRTTTCDVAPVEDATTGETTGGDGVYFETAVGDAKADALDVASDVKVPDTADAGADVVDVQQEGTIPQQACFQKHCPMPLLSCLKSSTCIAAITAAYACVTDCGGGQGCMVQCQANWSGDALAFSLAACGMLICGGGCGDGICSANETPTTCPGDCKVPTTGSCVGFCGGMSSDCYCDQPCKPSGTCCADYVAVCGG